MILEVVLAVRGAADDGGFAHFLLQKNPRAFESLVEFLASIFRRFLEAQEVHVAGGNVLRTEYNWIDYKWQYLGCTWYVRTKL